MTGTHVTEEEDSPHIGRHLKAIRKRARLTQDQLAERSGLSQSFVSQVERGNRDISQADILAWTTACGQPLELRLVKPVGDSLDESTLLLHNLHGRENITVLRLLRVLNLAPDHVVEHVTDLLEGIIAREERDLDLKRH